MKCAVVNEGGTNHRWPSEIPLWSHINAPDIEQNLFPAASYGVDMCDLHQAIAPRPLLALIEHYSPHFNQAAAHIRHRYEQLGAADHFSTVEANDPHAWTVKLRLASTDWLSRWLYSRPGPTREPDFELEKPETLYCTIHGSLRYRQPGRVHLHTDGEGRQSVSPAGDSQAGCSQPRFASCSQIKLSHSPLEVQQLAPTPRKGYRIEKVEFISEPGIYVPVWVFIPERPLDQ